MLTPQEVSARSFTKSVMGGYNMTMVDEFLDELTDDYTSLYKENASLKAKLKVLVEKVEEYRATEDSMRVTLLAAHCHKLHWRHLNQTRLAFGLIKLLVFLFIIKSSRFLLNHLWFFGFFGCFWLFRPSSSRQLPARGLGKLRQPFAVLQILQQKVIFRPVVWLSLRQIRGQLQPGLCHLNKQLIVTNHCKKQTVAIKAIFAKHSLPGDFPRPSQLPSGIFYKFQA